jgi:pyruvate kinase
MTKIVATIGPASEDAAIIRALINEGADVFRLNFSHGTREEHRMRIRKIRKIAKEAGKEVAILQDLCGPKIRTGEMANGFVILEAGSEVVITNEKVLGTNKRFSCIYEHFSDDVEVGTKILLDDGFMELTAVKKTGKDVLCTVISGGKLKSHKGMNLPGTKISSPSFTPRDELDLLVGIEEKVDFVALSFVREPGDIEKVRAVLRSHGCDTKMIIAKIERPEAIASISEIIDAADGVMVARGDLGVEMNLAEVPILQKEIIRKAHIADKYVITATQMLESMIQNSSPTRAEVSDIANAIIDGTDAVMLSGETASGLYPVKCVKMMSEIACRTEEYLKKNRPAWSWERKMGSISPLQTALGHATMKLYEDLSIKAILAFSASGGTALYLSKGRPFAPIVAFTASETALRRMQLFWGILPVYNPAIKDKDDLKKAAIRYVKDTGLAKDGDRILVLVGTQFGQVGSTDSITIVQICKEYK